MLNRFRWVVSLPTILLSALPGWANEDIGLSRSYYPVVPSSEIETLTCYAETSNGELLNLNRLCHPDFVVSDDPALAGGDDNRSGEAFGDRSTDQGTSCFFVDANGHPCP